MSLVRQLIQAVITAQRQIDDQISKLQIYKIEVDRVLQQVEIDLSGSTQTYALEMTEKLQETKQQVSDTINRLQAAKEMLNQVRMI